MFFYLNKRWIRDERMLAVQSCEMASTLTAYAKVAYNVEGLLSSYLALLSEAR